jgi:hypothetical protein
MISLRAYLSCSFLFVSQQYSWCGEKPSCLGGANQFVNEFMFEIVYNTIFEPSCRALSVCLNQTHDTPCLRHDIINAVCPSDEAAAINRLGWDGAKIQQVMKEAGKRLVALMDRSFANLEYQNERAWQERALECQRMLHTPLSLREEEQWNTIKIDQRLLIDEWLCKYRCAQDSILKQLTVRFCCEPQEIGCKALCDKNGTLCTSEVTQYGPICHPIVENFRAQRDVQLAQALREYGRSVLTYPARQFVNSCLLGATAGATYMSFKKVCCAYKKPATQIRMACMHSIGLLTWYLTALYAYDNYGSNSLSNDILFYTYLMFGTQVVSKILTKFVPDRYEERV